MPKGGMAGWGLSGGEKNRGTELNLGRGSYCKSSQREVGGRNLKATRTSRSSKTGRSKQESRQHSKQKTQVTSVNETAAEYKDRIRSQCAWRYTWTKNQGIERGNGN